MNKMIKDAGILCLITLISGLLLGGVYQITKAPREKQDELKKKTAYQTVFDQAKDFEDTGIKTDDIKSYLEEKSFPSNEVTIDEVVAAKAGDGTSLGYVFTVTEYEGYGGEITFTVGITQEGVINGISVLSINETAGLGMKAKEDAFLNQFKDKQVDSFTYTKSGAKEENEIDAISGATITTKAMTKGVNAAIESYHFLYNSEMDGQ